MSKNPTTEEICKTLQQLTTPEITPKELLKAIRKSYPKASKQDIVHAAFASLIEVADADPEKAKALHGFAIAARPSGAAES